MTGPSMLPQSERVRLRVLWSCVRFVHEEDPMLLLILIACNAVPAGSAAQADPWAAPLRGSWVRTGPAATGDVVLASRSEERRVGKERGRWQRICRRTAESG